MNQPLKNTETDIEKRKAKKNLVEVFDESGSATPLRRKKIQKKLLGKGGCRERSLK
jgi:hypothetical protein